MELKEQGRKKGARIPTMFQKQKGLAMNHENLAKIYIIETKIVSLSPVARAMGKRGIKKMPASPTMLLKTQVEKISPLS